MGPRYLQSQIHSDFSTNSGVWAAYKTGIESMYQESTSKVDFNDHLIREYNRKIDRLNQSTDLFIGPYDAGFRFIGDIIAQSGEFPLLNNLLAYWKLDETSGIRYDSHGVFDLADNYSVGSDTAIINNGAVFDGAQVLESDPAGFTIENGLTISFWVKPILSEIDVAIGFYVGDNAVYIGWLSDGSIFGDLGHGVNAYSDGANGSLTGDTWSHVVMRADPVAETWTAIVDGNFVVRGLPAPISSSPVGSIKVGANRDGITTEPMTGMLDEVAIWNRPLTDAEIAYLYNNGNGRPYEQF